jgi:hypothetical protein
VNVSRCGRDQSSIGAKASPPGVLTPWAIQLRRTRSFARMLKPRYVPPGASRKLRAFGEWIEAEARAARDAGASFIRRAK